MDAVSHKNCAVYFGGRYYENWSEDYTLSIRYENRRQVLARCGLVADETVERRSFARSLTRLLRRWALLFAP